MEDKSHKLFDLDEYKSNIVTQFPGFEDKRSYINCLSKISNNRRFVGSQNNFDFR